jgi:hypothetical protein
METRKIVNEAVGGLALPIDFLYTNWKDGGASLICLEERKDVMTLTNLAHLLCSIDVNTKQWFVNDNLDEVEKRNIITTDFNQ